MVFYINNICTDAVGFCPPFRGIALRNKDLVLFYSEKKNMKITISEDLALKLTCITLILNLCV